MIYPDATEIWHDVDISIHPDRVCFPRFKHQEIMLGVSGEEYSLGRKTWQRSGMYVCFAYYFLPQWHKCHRNTGPAVDAESGKTKTYVTVEATGGCATEQQRWMYIV